LLKLRTRGVRGSEFTTVDFLVGASGYNATLSRSLVANAKYSSRETFLASLDLGLQAGVKGDFTDAFQDDRIDIVFSPDSPGAEYFYVFPFTENFGYVGYVSTFENRRTCKDRLLKSIQRYGTRINEDVLPKLKGKFIPGAGTLVEPCADRFLAVGDEAGQVEPIFRGGIRLGCETGKIAGEVISSGIRDDFISSSLAEYGRRIALIPALGYAKALGTVKNSIIPRICSHAAVTDNEVHATLQAFNIIENSGW
jgi:flavin-dependent dehydrogenase